MYRLSLVTAALAFTASCGLIDADITDFDLSVPERTFTMDTAQWQLTTDPTFPEVPCGNPPPTCSSLITAACGAALCSGTCDGSFCQAAVFVSLFDQVDLFSEKPELQKIDDQPLLKVSLSRISYDVMENTLNIASPEMMVYVGPQTVQSPGDPQAVAFARIAPVPAGTTVLNQDVELIASGQQALRDLMSDYRTPFNIILGTQLQVSAGDVVPMGRIAATIRVQATAGL